jgi:DNA repair exonuclease SbcCD ATPase subunit
MSTNYSNGSGDNRAKKLLPWAIAAIVALVGTNIATFVGLNSKKSDLVTTQVELKKEEDLNAQLDQQYKDAIAQLEEMKGKNTELNSLIDQQKAELTAQKDKISGLINVKKDLASARSELSLMKGTVQKYVDQIALLEQDKKNLSENVATLTTEKTKLQEDFTKERADKEQVLTAKTAIEQEKAKIEEEKAVLAKKTEIGSVVRITNISTKGYSVSEKGKLKEKTHAKNIDRLKWCFDALENRVIDAGNETFYVRVIDPTGVAIASTSGGGGVLKLNDGREVQYTTTTKADFKNDMQNVCMEWDSKGNATLAKGKYLIEVYNKGYLAGKSDFELK